MGRYSHAEIDKGTFTWTKPEQIKICGTDVFWRQRCIIINRR